MHALPIYWPEATAHLCAHDTVMAGLIARYDGEGLSSHGNAFYTLARSIVGQQISVKAADAVWEKLGNRIQDSGFREMSVESLLAMTDDALRACGLSRQKVTYLQAIAAHFEAKGIGPGYFDAMEDAEVISELVGIKGVGKWTAEMFLIFHLMRPDVFPVDDIGVQKAIQRHYAMDTPSRARRALASTLKGRGREGAGISKKAYYQQLTAHAEQWRPYRTVATWYLWRALDPVVVAY